MKATKFRTQPPIADGCVRVHFLGLDRFSPVSWATWLAGKLHGFDMTFVHCALQTDTFYIHATYDGIEYIDKYDWYVFNNYTSVFIDVPGYVEVPGDPNCVTYGAVYRAANNLPREFDDMTCVTFVLDMLGYENVESVVTPVDLYYWLIDSDLMFDRFDKEYYDGFSYLKD